MPINLSIDLLAPVKFLISKCDKWRSVKALLPPKHVSETLRGSGDLLTEILGRFYPQNKINTCWQCVRGDGAAAAEEEIPATACYHTRLSQSRITSAPSSLCFLSTFQSNIAATATTIMKQMAFECVCSNMWNKSDAWLKIVQWSFLSSMLSCVSHSSSSVLNHVCDTIAHEKQTLLVFHCTFASIKPSVAHPVKWNEETEDHQVMWAEQPLSGSSAGWIANGAGTTSGQHHQVSYWPFQ